MKKIFTLLAFSCIAFSVSAQQPQNGGFENWNGTTLYMDAPSYLGTGQASYLTVGAGNVYSVPSPVQGVSAAHLETVSNGIDTLPGALLHGYPAGNAFVGGSPYNERPDSLVFYANYNVMAGDTATIIVGLEFMNNMLGYALGAMWGNSGGWVRMSVPFAYIAPTVMPDSLCCFISSSNLLSTTFPDGIPGSMLEIDNIQLVNATAQVPNPFFEVWTSSIVLEPDGWYTLNFGNIYDFNYSVTPDNNAYMGNYDCLIETTVAEWGDTIGYITNGNFNGPNGPAGGMAVYQNPEKITGYYKYIPVGNDTAIAGAWTTRWDAVGDSAIPYDAMLVWLTPASSWTYFEVNLSYNAFPYPDTLTMAFASSNFENYVGIGVGSQLYLDEIGVSYYPLNMSEYSAVPVTVFPNPATRFLNVRLENIPAGENVLNVYDAQGRLVKSAQIMNGGQVGFYTLEVNDLAPGTYVWEITNGAEKSSAAFVKQ